MLDGCLVHSWGGFVRSSEQRSGGPGNGDEADAEERCRREALAEQERTEQACQRRVEGEQHGDGARADEPNGDEVETEGDHDAEQAGNHEGGHCAGGESRRGL